jgi:serine/threonine-protein kinase HipA
VSQALGVWWDGGLVGMLRVDLGDMTFTYTSEWLADQSRLPLSVSLPKQPEPFKRHQCRAFFAGLLPEEDQRLAAAQSLGISRGNDFRLLEALGGEVAGALSLWPEGQSPPAIDTNRKARFLNDDDLVEIFDMLPVRPLLAGHEGLRLSLAGAQPKVPVVLDRGRIGLPAPGQPTTHILKPALARFPATTENEALVMSLASALRLPVAQVEARTVKGRPFLLVARYDRRVDASGRVRRLHQEDFCQALGVVPEEKYASEGGPTFKSSFELLRRVSTRPAVEVLQLVDAAIFNVIAGNSDAHGKNFSLLYDEGGIGFAPLYDLLCTVAYSQLSPKFAMKIAKAATLEEIRATIWAAFAEDVGTGAPYIRMRVRELTDAVPDALSSAVTQVTKWGLDSEALTKFAELIGARATRLRKTI